MLDGRPGKGVNVEVFGVGVPSDFGRAGGVGSSEPTDFTSTTAKFASQATQRWSPAMRDERKRWPQEGQTSVPRTCSFKASWSDLG